MKALSLPEKEERIFYDNDWYDYLKKIRKQLHVKFVSCDECNEHFHAGTGTNEICRSCGERR